MMMWRKLAWRDTVSYSGTFIGGWVLIQLGPGTFTRVKSLTPHVGTILGAPHCSVPVLMDHKNAKQEMICYC